MNADFWLKVFTLLISLIQAVVWPLTLLIIAFYLRIPIKRFIGEIMEVTLKAGPVETTAKSKQALEVAASLAAAAEQIQTHNPEQERLPFSESTKGIAKLVDQTVTPQSVQKLAGILILWVDDRPVNNTYARHALEALGIRFTISISTDEALEEIKHTSFNAVISDMGRPPDAKAGYTLLEKMRASTYDIPFIIYSRGGNSPKNREEARKRGVYASAAGPQDLYKTVVELFNKSAKTG